MAPPLGASAPTPHVIQNILVHEVGTWLLIVYYILLLAVSDGAPTVYIVVNRVKTLIPALGALKHSRAYDIVIAVIFQIVVIVMASQGLTPIVNKHFQYLGYVGQVINLVPLLIIWPILRRKGVKAIIPEFTAQDRFPDMSKT